MNDAKMIPLISLNSMSSNKMLGGVGIHDITKRNLVIGGKLIWTMYTHSQSKWCKIMQAKYPDSENALRIFTISNPPNGPTMWNFMMSCWQVVTSYISWLVHKGEVAVHFWNDSWNGYPPLNDNVCLRLIIPILSQIWGVRLIDFIDSVEISSGRVTWRECSQIQFSEEHKDIFHQILNQRVVFLSNKDDTVIWVASKDRKYSIKQGYKAIKNKEIQMQS